MRVVAAVQRAEHVVGPAEQRGAVRGGDAEHVADDDQRQRCGEVVPEVALPALADRVDQLVADPADARQCWRAPARA